MGSGVRAAGAQKLLIEIARKNTIPILTSMNAVDLVQDDLHIGFIGTHGNRVANMIAAESDLIIAVGVRLGLRQVGRNPKNFAPKAHIVRVDIDENELARSVHEDEEKILMDAKAFLEKLAESNVPDYSDWYKRCFELKNFLSNYDKEIGNVTVESISRLLPKNAIVSVDVGQHQCWCAQSLLLKGQNGRIFIGGGYGSMGCGLPYAIGASIAAHNEKVFCIVGDGGFQMNIQELETVKRESLPIKIMILNNHVLGKISETQRKSHGERYAQTAISGGYTVPDFSSIANSYGIKAVKISCIDQLAEYEEWLFDDEACLMDIALPENTSLVPKMDFNSGFMRPELEGAVEKIAKKIIAL